MSYFESRPWLSSYADGVPADIPPTTQTLTDMLDASVKRYGRRVALDFFGQTLTYRELGDAAARVAEGLRMRWVGHGG